VFADSAMGSAEYFGVECCHGSGRRVEHLQQCF